MNTTKTKIIKEVPAEYGEQNGYSSRLNEELRIVRFKGKLCVQAKRNMHTSTERITRLERARRKPSASKWVNVYSKLMKGRDGLWRGYSREYQYEVELKPNTIEFKRLVELLDEARVEEVEQILLG